MGFESWLLSHEPTLDSFLLEAVHGAWPFYGPFGGLGVPWCLSCIWTVVENRFHGFDASFLSIFDDSFNIMWYRLAMTHPSSTHPPTAVWPRLQWCRRSRSVGLVKKAFGCCILLVGDGSGHSNSDDQWYVMITQGFEVRRGLTDDSWLMR